MERLPLTNEYYRKRTDMRYASPDGTRPNPELVKRAQHNFMRRQHHPTPPSPSALPQPSLRLLTHPNTRPNTHSNTKSKSPKPITIQGRNRRWTIKTHQKKATPPNNNNNAQGIKMKNKPKKRSKRSKRSKSSKKKNQKKSKKKKK